ncbi:SURF1 family protein [Streptomyces sp. AJS327]|uniref:SURF1 family cytochrome oxidase biogenesis protein n=1 Tax=Streptomyces sp. AJS327 TaxID=2545265 RepID=UPI0015E02838|nr:SURF1 family protein [Streptomyces sp. AJS327]MBA0050499.1 SURF1 family protein [Streptomyces sp. AJS327]
MYRFLLSRQWVMLTLVALLLIPVTIRLGFWQLHRHEDRVERNDRVAASLDAPPVPVTRLTSTDAGPRTEDKFRAVTATGRYDAEHEVVVRQRTASDEQSIGYFVVTPLVLANGDALLVNRGWVDADNDLTQHPEVPAPPRGEVRVTGRLMPDETTAASGIKDRKGLPPRQVMLINSRQQAARLDGPALHGFIQLTATSPKPAGTQPELLPKPDSSGIGPHMAYAVQWWLFTAAVPVGWIILLRRERADRLAARANGGADGPDGAGPAGDTAVPDGASGPDGTTTPDGPDGPDGPDPSDGPDGSSPAVTTDGGGEPEPGDTADAPERTADETAEGAAEGGAPAATARRPGGGPVAATAD